MCNKECMEVYFILCMHNDMKFDLFYACQRWRKWLQNFEHKQMYEVCLDDYT